MSNVTISGNSQGGNELGYAAITSSVTNTNGTTITDVAGLTVTVTVGARPIIVKYRGSGLSNSVNNGGSVVLIYEGSTQLTGGNTSDGTGTVVDQANAEVRLAPTAGSHTYKIRTASVFSGNTTLVASATLPAYIQVIEC